MKLKRILTLILFIVCCHSLLSIAYKTPGQTPEQIESLTQYYDSGQYIKDIEKAIKKARIYVDVQIRNRRQEKLAVVIDVDETALSNYHHLKRLTFTSNIEAFTGAYLLGDLPALEPIKLFYDYMINNNVNVFFVTSRPNSPEVSAVTVMNLKKAGYHTWEKLYMRPVHLDNLSTSAFKQQARKEIAHHGYNIILTIGDQDSDLEGGFTEAKAKLPNPFYEVS